ncbi:MAG: hypothetical protein RR547_09850 [Raoultibacter sp.]
MSKQRNLIEKSHTQGDLRTCSKSKGANPLQSLKATLSDTRGFVLAEQVISIVFIGLLCVVIGVGLTAAFQSYRTAQETTRAHELLTRAVSEVSDDLAFARAIDGTGVDCAYISPTTNTLVRLGNDVKGSGIVLMDAASKSDSTTGLLNGATTGGSTDFSGDAVSSNEVLFVPSSQGLTVAISDVECNSDQKSNTLQWSYRIEILRATDGVVLADTDMVVAWIG